MIPLLPPEIDLHDYRLEERQRPDLMNVKQTRHRQLIKWIAQVSLPLESLYELHMNYHFTNVSYIYMITSHDFLLHTKNQSIH